MITRKRVIPVVLYQNWYHPKINLNKKYPQNIIKSFFQGFQNHGARNMDVIVKLFSRNPGSIPTSISY